MSFQFALFLSKEERIDPLCFDGSSPITIVQEFTNYEWIQTGAMHVRPLLLAGAFSLIMSVQFFSLGLLGEMMNGNKKRTYPVSESIGEL